MNRKIVLAITQDATLPDRLQAALDPDRYMVASGRSGAHAVRMTVSMKPHMILLDSGLPDGDGSDIAAAVREWTGSPLLVCLAQRDEEEIRAAFAAGATDYVVKPIAIDMLAARVRRHLLRAGAGWRLAG